MDALPLPLPSFMLAPENAYDAAKSAPNSAAEGLPTAETVPNLTHLDSQCGIETCSPEGALQRAFPRWPPERRKALVSQVLRRHTRVLTVEDSEFPIDDDIPGCPAVLFVEGRRPEVLTAPRVAVVGTRAASVHGLTDAWELGAFLGAAGVSVVSGMAIGIDGAAHHGALQAAEAAASRGEAAVAGPVGVVATGLDVVYPRRHRVLYERVRRHGVVLGEHPFGVTPERGRFPVRNRIIAALADVVVVVEATLSGGSRITADRALDYGRPVLAVPGSRRNPAAAGCNALLADGAQPLLDPSDVLVALGLTPGARRLWTTAPGATKPPPASPAAESILKALGGEAAHPDQLASRTGLDPGQIAMAVEELVALGRATRDRGFVWPT
jgi:DNA processing protein